MVRVLVLCLVTLPVALSARPSGAQELVTRLTLEDAVRLATRENPTLRAKGFELESARTGEITAGLRPNPTASYLMEQLGTGNEPQQTVTIGQTLELGGKRLRRLDSARAATRVAGYDLTEVRRQILFQVKRAYADVLAAQAALDLAEQNLRTLAEIERVQRFRAEKGDISELELLRLQVQQFAFQRDALEARQALQTAKIALRAVAGPDRIAQAFEVVGDLTFREVRYPGPDLVTLALANRPDLRSAEAAREKARADVNLARANPTWDVTPLLEYQRLPGNHTVGFAVSVPIRVFDRNQGEIARTMVEADRAEELRRAVLAQVRAEVLTALAALEGQRQKVLALRDVYLPKA
jgi:cobalt-zinc-cadmium efflux system outer membrane protein